MEQMAGLSADLPSREALRVLAAAGLGDARAAGAARQDIASFPLSLLLFFVPKPARRQMSSAA